MNTDFLMWCTGVVFWSVLAGLFLWYVVIEVLIVGTATSFSYHRWMLKSPTHKVGWNRYLFYFIFSFLGGIIEYRGYRNHGNHTVRYEGGSGYWRGIGDWSVPKLSVNNPDISSMDPSYPYGEDSDEPSTRESELEQMRADGDLDEADEATHFYQCAVCRKYVMAGHDCPVKTQAEIEAELESSPSESDEANDDDFSIPMVHDPEICSCEAQPTVRRVFLMARTLFDEGYYVGPRDPNRNTKYPGAYMVCEDPSEGPSEDSANTEFCLVGETLEEVVQESYMALGYNEGRLA